jgi:hypothetical protein
MVGQLRRGLQQTDDEFLLRSVPALAAYHRTGYGTAADAARD